MKELKRDNHISKDPNFCAISSQGNARTRLQFQAFDIIRRNHIHFGTSIDETSPWTSADRSPYANSVVQKYQRSFASGVIRVHVVISILTRRVRCSGVCRRVKGPTRFAPVTGDMTVSTTVEAGLVESSISRDHDGRFRSGENGFV